MSTDLDAIRLRAATWFRPGTQHPVERDVLDLLDEVERLRRVLDKLPATFRLVASRCDHDPKLQRCYELAARIVEEHSADG